MTTLPQLNKPDLEELRAKLDAPLGEAVDELLVRASQRTGRQLFTVPQALAAIRMPAQTQQQKATGQQFELRDEDRTMIEVALRMQATACRRWAEIVPKEKEKHLADAEAHEALAGRIGWLGSEEIPNHGHGSPTDGAPHAR